MADAPKFDFGEPFAGFEHDGVHRICRAHLDGRKTIPAVRFETDPEPDRIHPMDREKV